MKITFKKARKFTLRTNLIAEEDFTSLAAN